MGWGSFLKATLRLGGRMTSATAHTLGGAMLHPQQTLKGVGTATKSAVVGGSLGYIGWEKLTTDKSVVGIVSDAVIGRRHHQEDRRHRIWDWRWRKGLERLCYGTFRQRKWSHQQCGFQMERYVRVPQSHVLWAWWRHVW